MQDIARSLPKKSFATALLSVCIEQSEILSGKFTMRCSLFAIIEAGVKLVVVAVVTFASSESDM